MMEGRMGVSAPIADEVGPADTYSIEFLWLLATPGG
jgi:hypothetical protein